MAQTGDGEAPRDNERIEETCDCVRVPNCRQEVAGKMFNISV